MLIHLFIILILLLVELLLCRFLSGIFGLLALLLLFVVRHIWELD